MAPVAVELLPVAADHRPDFPGMKPIPAGYDLDRVTLVRADQVREGDLVVGDLGGYVSRARGLRWTGWLAAAYVAQPGEYSADCAHCRAWMSGYDGPAVTLSPHCPVRADMLTLIVPAPQPVEPARRPCVHACTCRNGRIPVETRFVPWPTCWHCHGQACAVCAGGGSCSA